MYKFDIDFLNSKKDGTETTAEKVQQIKFCLVKSLCVCCKSDILVHENE